MNQQITHSITEFESDKTHFRTLVQNFGKVIVLIFYADWDKNSKTFLQSFSNSITIFGDYKNVVYFSVSSEKCPQTFKKYGVEKTPTVVFTETQRKIYSKHEDQNIGVIFDDLESISKQHAEQHQKLKPIFYQKCQDLLKSSPIIVFMKGTPTSPKCGFVSQLVKLMEVHNIEYAFYDIDIDQDVRHWLRSYTKYKTYPTIYVNGKVVGGLDTFKQIAEKGQLKKYFPQSAFKSTPQERFSQYLEEHKNDVVALIDGFPFQNQQSRQIIEKIKSNQKQENLFIWNIGLDAKMKQIAQQKFARKIPFVIRNSQVA